MSLDGGTPPPTNSPPEEVTSGQTEKVEENLPLEVEVAAETNAVPLPIEDVPTPITVFTDFAADIGLAKDTMEDCVIVKLIFYPEINPQYVVVVLIGADGIGGSGEAGEVFSETAVHLLWTGVRKLLPHAERFERMMNLATHEQCWEALNALLSTGDPARDPLMSIIFWVNGFIRAMGKSMFWKDVCTACQEANPWGQRQCFKCGQALTQAETDNEETQPEGWGCTVVATVAVCDLTTGEICIHGYDEGDACIALDFGGNVEVLSVEHNEPVVKNNQTHYVLSRWLGRSNMPGGHRFERKLRVTKNTTARLVICSDGVTNMLPTQEIVHFSGSCQALIQHAFSVETAQSPTHNPGDDNALVAKAEITVKEN